MGEFLPFITGDYSVGLYSKTANDIYHSVYGALTEAYDKFIAPIDLINFVKDKDKINVLDICYGIGYNSKILINEFINNNLKNELQINCVDNDLDFMKLSPFIKNKISLIDIFFNKDLITNNISDYKNGLYKKIKFKRNRNLKINKLVNIILLNSLKDEFKINEINETLKKYVINDKNHVFMDASMLDLIKNLQDFEVYLHQNKNKSTYLHNIYYKNIPKQYNRVYKYTNIHCNFYPIDVRRYIVSTNESFDLIFLDGFTPLKSPALWSIDFINKLYSHITDDGLLLTYNTSVLTKSTLVKAGFNIGNIIKDKKVIGTIASKNKLLIKDELSPSTYGLLLTKAGIPFRDPNLDLDDKIILNNRKLEVTNSQLESSSRYLKRMPI